MVRANKRNEALRIESALLNKIAMLELRRQRKLWELISRRSAGGRGTGFQSSQCCLLFLNGASLTTTWLDWHDKLLRFSPIKNARRQPSVLIKSRWSSEVITGSINRSNYDKTTQSLPDKIHKHILRDRFLSSFKQPGRFRAELEKVKLMQKEKGHE